MLQRAVGDKDVELMNLTEFRHQFLRREHIAHFPAGDAIGFTERGDDKAAFGEPRITRDAFMPRAVIDQVFINLVADDDDIGVVQQAFECPHIVRG